MKIAIIPSNQGGIEESIMVPVGVACVAELVAVGVDAKLFDDAAPVTGETARLASLRAMIDRVNAWGADYAVSPHSNADGGSKRVNGILNLVYSDRTRDWATQLGTDYAEHAGYVWEGAKTPAEIGRGSLMFLSRTRMPAVIVEIGAWDTATELSLIRGQEQRLGSLLAHSIVRSLGLDVETEHPSASGLFVGDVAGRFNWGGGVTRETVDLIMARHIRRDHKGEADWL